MRLYLRIIFAVVYTLIYFFLALANFARGDVGTLIFFTPSLTWVLVIAAIFLLSKEATPFRRVLIPVMLAAHYLGTITSLVQNLSESDLGFWRQWEYSPAAIIITTLWYIIGQIIIWIVYLTRVKQGGELK